MYKIFLMYSLVLVLAEGHLDDRETFGANSSSIEGYINMQRQKYWKILQHYDSELRKFNQDFSKNIQILKKKLFTTTHVIDQVKCKDNVIYCKSAITSYIIDVSNQVSKLLVNATRTKNVLVEYYVKYFEKEIKDCGKKNDILCSKYVICVTNVKSFADAYTNINQEIFNGQMDVAVNTKRQLLRKDIAFTIPNHQ